ncbi:TonB-dependent receptor plug domain-containing protein, partial [Sphingomonas sp.]|uniref:TonB-dependent receptor plug domain-containing protein n=1 Tax=Sphingomonas sp. TaxID=28214 RepID=UPI00286A368D
MVHFASRSLRAAILSTTAVAALIAVPGLAQAQDATVATTAATDKAAGEEIIVLGTRRTDRTVTNSASPIDVISAAELKSQPTGNILDSLKNIIPSFFSSTNSIADASSLVRAPSLRGLPSDEVLVQLNGKRF